MTKSANSPGNPNAGKKGASLAELDDPLDWDIEEQGPSTKRPSFQPDEFAQKVETAEDRATLPPAPAYEMLRDSCKDLAIADDVLLDDASAPPPPKKDDAKPRKGAG
jgi:hypothetical protein